MQIRSLLLTTMAAALLMTTIKAQEAPPMPKPVAPNQQQNQPVATPTVKEAPGTPENKPVEAAQTSNDVPPKAVASMDLAAIDKTADPCTDFYQFACGNWVKNTSIPSDQSRWGRFSELALQNQWMLRHILEAAAKGGASRDATEQKIGDFYAACMDEAAANRKGATPIKPELDRIAAIKSSDDIMPIVIALHNQGTRVLFRFGSGQDFRDASQVIAEAEQGGLGLPDRDYYLKDDGKYPGFRKAYVEHMAKMFTLVGWNQQQASAAADRILALETKLAQASMDRVSQREPSNIYHKMTVEQANALAPHLSFTRYLEGVQAPAGAPINIAEPDFFKTASALIASEPLDAWKDYLAWTVVRDRSRWLSDDLYNESFAFNGKTLRGQPEPTPRWKRCVAATNQELGEALGKVYVKEAFGPQAKARMDELVANLESSLGKDIEGLDWMTDATKKEAIVKLKAITNKIGYPEKWRDYSSVAISPDDLLGNLDHASAFEFHREINKIGKPVDKLEWDMTPPTVNADYDASLNNVNFPAGILQPPFFDEKIDDAVNYGGIGVVIGHELTHGFDDEGRQFDDKGNLRDWWTAADAKAFNEHAACIVNEYGSFTSVTINGEPVKLNGKLTLGENTADNGGLRISYAALQQAMQKDGGNLNGPEKDGFTPAQRFFLGFGQVWCESTKPETALMMAKVDPHSPGKFRANGAVQNFPEFGKAFGCKVGQPMMPQNPCRVW